MAAGPCYEEDVPRPVAGCGVGEGGNHEEHPGCRNRSCGPRQARLHHTCHGARSCANEKAAGAGRVRCVWGETEGYGIRRIPAGVRHPRTCGGQERPHMEPTPVCGPGRVYDERRVRWTFTGLQPCPRVRSGRPGDAVQTFARKSQSRRRRVLPTCRPGRAQCRLKGGGKPSDSTCTTRVQKHITNM